MQDGQKTFALEFDHNLLSQSIVRTNSRMSTKSK